MELRVLEADMGRDGSIIKGGRYKGTYGGWSKNAGLIARWGSKLQGVSAYVTVNPVNTALLARSNKLERQKNTTADAEIVCLRHAFIDIDPKRPAGISATEQERAAAVECRETILTDHESIRDSATWGCSGNGSWILVRLPDYPNDQEHRAMVERFLKALAARYSGDYRGVKVEIDPSTFNPSRIMALVGTLKCKGVDTSERPHRLVTLDSPLATKPISFDLKSWLALHAPEEQPGSHKTNGKPNDDAWKSKASSGSGTFPKPRITVFDDYNAKARWFDPDLLAGVKVEKTLTNGEIQLTRPGKDDAVSGTIGHEGRDVFKCFSSNWPPFAAGGCYSRFQAYALLHHAGDQARAAAELSARGFGTYIDHDGSEKQNPPPADWGKAKTASSTPKADLSWVATDYATLADADRELKDLDYAWDLWIPRGSITAIVADAGLGKTRVVAEWCTRLWLGEPMPDGTNNPFPAGTKTLWLCYDRNWRGLVRSFTQFGVPKEAVLLPTHKGKPLWIPDFDKPETMNILWRFIEVHKPGWIVVDTTTYASVYNTGKPNDAKVAYDPIMDVLMHTACACLGLTHTNREGGVLNRRFLERCRVKIEITRPDPAFKHRLRIEATKSDDKLPPPLGALFTDTGVVYDTNPPEAPEAPQRGRKPTTSPGLAEFLWEYLQPGPAFLVDIVHAAQDKALLKAPTTQEPKPSISPLYDARRWVARSHPGKIIHQFEMATDNGKTLKAWEIADEQAPGPDVADDDDYTKRDW